jgi:4-hydroxythreonine-4-phosphate dehydrogenase
MSVTAEKPPIALTMGDPAGIGPEITVKLFDEPDARDDVVVFGDVAMLARAIKSLGAKVTLVPLAKIQDFQPKRGTLPVLPLSDLPADLAFGKVDARAGAAAYRYVTAAIEAGLKGEIRAICTAPIHKEAFKAAGVKYPGHTEILADLTGTRDYAMMLMNHELRTLLVTIHLSLRDAIDALTIEGELTAIRLAHEACQRLGVAKPRVAVAGLNPHAGEGGLFGREDIDIIAPAVAQARAAGIDASGPWAGDTVFMRARKGEFDIVVAQYHDQGLIPVKYLGVDEGVNITVGLPFPRTSVDHGTAFDIAGKGIADHASLKVALEQAAAMSA